MNNQNRPEGLVLPATVALKELHLDPSEGIAFDPSDVRIWFPHSYVAGLIQALRTHLLKLEQAAATAPIAEQPPSGIYITPLGVELMKLDPSQGQLSNDGPAKGNYWFPKEYLEKQAPRLLEACPPHAGNCAYVGPPKPPKSIAPQRLNLLPGTQWIFTPTSGNTVAIAVLPGQMYDVRFRGPASEEDDREVQQHLQEVTGSTKIVSFELGDENNAVRRMRAAVACN